MQQVTSCIRRSMAIAGRGFAVVLAAFLVVFASTVKAAEITEDIEDVDYIVPLDYTNFTDFVYKQDFIVVEFYAPWCGACKGFYPEYKKAAKELVSHDPPIILAKIDASADENKDYREKYGVRGYPTIKTFRNQGKYIENYPDKRNAAGMIPFFKRLRGPPSVEIKSVEDAAKYIDDKSVFTVGLFPEFSGEAYENFTTLAETLRTKYSFGHTSDFKVLPRRERFNKPTLRLFRPFDDLFVDFQNFDVNAMKSFIVRATTPLLTMFDGDDLNEKYVDKFFNNPKSKAMLFVNFDQEYDAFKPLYYDLAKLYKQKGLSFMLGDTDVSANAFKYFGLNKAQAPLIIVYDEDGTKFLKTKVTPEEIAPWLIAYKENKLEPYIRSQPIPQVNDTPVKVVVRDTLQQIVFESGKDVFLELYESFGCGLCKRLAPVLEEIAVDFQNDEDIVIAKLDTNSNDIEAELFHVEDFPTMYLKTATGKTILYEGDKRYKKEDIIAFIEKNRDTPSKTPKEELTPEEATLSETESPKEESTPEAAKDEL